MWKAWLFGSIMDGVNPELPKAQGSFDPLGVGSASFMSCGWGCMLLNALLAIGFGVLSIGNDGDCRAKSFRRLGQRKVGWPYLEVTESSSASASDVLPSADAVVPMLPTFNCGKLSLKFLTSSSLGFWEFLL